MPQAILELRCIDCSLCSTYSPIFSEFPVVVGPRIARSGRCHILRLLRCLVDIPSHQDGGQRNSIAATLVCNATRPVDQLSQMGSEAFVRPTSSVPTRREYPAT